ncbi:MAG: helix-turn-helix transcriptional regulator [Tissierellia bacterium]|nr:helix-turn-helix transcriptional regulator [Tissierellia bacterium]
MRCFHVTRQTISNWETGKNYPDVHSLLLLSNFFGITLDKLVRGDLKIMKKKIESVEIKKVERLFTLLTSLFVVMIVSAAPLIFLLKTPGIIIWGIIAAITILVSFKAERVKKDNDIQTYKEIMAFMNGETLDNISKAKEMGKKNYQKLIFTLGLAIFTFVIVVLIAKVLQSIL